jgi:hypothetical protein
VTSGRAVFLVAGVAVLAIGLIVSSSAARRRQGIAFILAWFIPGAGHALLGRWKKAAFFFAILALTYVFGLWLSGWRTVSFDDNPFYYVGQFGSGLTMLLGHVLGDPKSFPRDDIPKSWYDPGLLYVCVVGLLNLVIMLSVFDVKSGDEAKSPTPAAKPVEPSPEPAPEVKA